MTERQGKKKADADYSTSAFEQDRTAICSSRSACPSSGAP